MKSSILIGLTIMKFSQVYFGFLIYLGAVIAFNIPVVQAQQALSNEALIYRTSDRYSRGDFRGALVDIERLIQLKPGIADYYVFRGDIREKLGNIQGAVSDFKKAIELSPTSQTIQGRFAYYFYSRKLWNHAAAVYSKIIKLNPRNAASLMMRGNCYRELGNYQAAIADYSDYILIQPDDPRGYQFRAFAYEKMGLLDQAKKDIDRANFLNTAH